MKTVRRAYAVSAYSVKGAPILPCLVQEQLSEAKVAKQLLWALVTYLDKATCAGILIRPEYVKAKAFFGEKVTLSNGEVVQP